MPINRFREFIKLESKSSILLLIAAVIAICISNSPWSSVYTDFINYPLILSFQQGQLTTSIKLLVNEGLMTIFFFLIGLEIKRGVLIGELNSRKKVLLPFLASVSGMLMAALIYLAINGTVAATSSGWAIPTATDIAFSSAVLMLLGKAVPGSLRLFLTTLAIIDDLIAAVIIALFYSSNFHILFLLLAMVCLLILFFFNKIGITQYFLYLVFGALLWFFVLQSDISPAVSGVLVAFTIPLRPLGKNLPSLLETLENNLHPWVAFCILPLFVFVNAGLSFTGIHLAMFYDPLTLGIILGLFVGKQVGVFGACWLAVKAKIAKLPDGIDWYQLYGMAVLCGIGFTMNLFIGFLAFRDNANYLNLVKLGILSASLLSAVVGYWILRCNRLRQ
jgi:NhaA family Na+:H+ antiporter